MPHAPVRGRHKVRIQRWAVQSVEFARARAQSRGFRVCLYVWEGKMNGQWYRADVGGDTKLRRRGYLTPAQSFSLSDLLTFFAAYFLPLRRSVVGNFRSCECIFFCGSCNSGKDDGCQNYKMLMHPFWYTNLVKRKYGIFIYTFYYAKS